MVRMGIKVEQDSIDFYSDAKTKVTDPAVFNLYNVLLTSEDVHLFLLELLERDIISGSKST